MAPRKNTAQAFEVLYRIAQEEEAKRKSKKLLPDRAQPAVSEADPAAVEPKATPAPLHRVERAPLLAREAESPLRGRHGGASSGANAGSAPRARSGSGRTRFSRGGVSRLAEPTSAEAGAGAGEDRGHRESIVGRPRAPRELPRPRAEEERTASEERAILLEDGVVDGWVQPLRAAVDPVLLDPAEADDWGSARRLRFVEASEPLREPGGSASVPASSPDAAGASLAASHRELPPGPASRPRPQPEQSERPRDAVPHGATDTGTQGCDADENGAPLASAPPSAASRALRRGWSCISRGASWALGDGSTKLLERRMDLKVSTLCVAAMAGVVATTLVLTYLRMPGEEDALFRSTPGTVSPTQAGAPSGVVEPAGEPRKEVEVPLLAADPPSVEEPRAATAVRRFPLWSPGSSVPLEGGGAVKSPGPPEEVRNVTGQAGDASRDSSSEPKPAASTEASRSSARFLIQVRAKESWEGAQKILEYLSLFGFDKPLIEVDPRGERNTYGEKLYTVFVGGQNDRGEAERECERLKRETRVRPYKNKPDFFGDCLVITRAR